MTPAVFSNNRYVDDQGAEHGGQCQIFTPAVALNYGDAVYFSAANTVTKSTTPGDYVAFAGFVVGGDLTFNAALLTRPATGTVQVASANGSVLVQIDGVVYLINAATPAAGSRVIGDTVTAGRVAAGVTAGQILATLIEVGVAGDLTRAIIRHR